MARSRSTTEIIDGYECEVEYTTEGDGSGPSYSPRFGADSGDPLIILIGSIYSEEYGEVILSDEEKERLEIKIAETYLEDYDDESDYYR